MASEDYYILRAYTHDTAAPIKDSWRRSCGCIKTSDKLKQILKTFPPPPPPTPMPSKPSKPTAVTCISSSCKHEGLPSSGKIATESKKAIEQPVQETRRKGSWHLVAGLVSLLQLSVTATALALYYLIYCYMQLIYYTLKSALYFHHADGPMKITIGVMTLTSLVIGFNLLLRMERLIGIGDYHK